MGEPKPGTGDPGIGEKVNGTSLGPAPLNLPGVPSRGHEQPAGTRGPAQGPLEAEKGEGPANQGSAM